MTVQFLCCHNKTSIFVFILLEKYTEIHVDIFVMFI